MKTINELFQVMAEAVKDETSKTWFFDYHGHVNNLNIRYHRFGWKEGREADIYLTFKLNNETEITAAYWLIKSTL